MTTIESIIKAKFLASETQVTNLATIAADGITATAIYLGIVVAHTQAALDDRKRVTPKVQEQQLDEVHKRLYPCVLAGIGDKDTPTDERNAKATYARTAVSDLRYFVRAGGDIRTLDPATVKKGQLRAQGRSVPTGTRTERTIARTLDTFERTVQRIAKANPEDARREIEEAQARLEALLATLEEQPKPRKHKGKRPAKKATRTTTARAVRRAPVRAPVEQPRAH